MSTLHECLKQLPPDMVMRDHVQLGEKTPVTVKELLDTVNDEGGYRIVERKYNYGKTTKMAVVTGGMTLYSEW